MKSGIRVLAVACAPTEKKKTLLVGIISRKDYIEGVLSTNVTVDGTDATEKIAGLLNRSKFNDQVRIVAINGLGIAGLNIMDVEAFERATKTKVVSITRKRPRPNELIKALRAFSKEEKKDVKERIALVEKIKKINCIRAGNFYMQTTLERGEAAKFVEDAFELVRLAHIIARGVATGESKGRI